MASNKKIFEGAKIVRAKKLEVLTIALGEVGTLKPLEGVIQVVDGLTRIWTKESPKEGTEYPQDGMAVVRVLGGKVLIDGMYDIYAIPASKVPSKLKNQVDMASLLSNEQMDQLKPILECGHNPKAYLTPEEIRKVILIKEDGVCYNEWDPETPCEVHKGDVFVVSDEVAMTGYRIGKEEFQETHVFMDT